jgi:hypothetical protein
MTLDILRAGHIALILTIFFMGICALSRGAALLIFLNSFHG